MPAAKHLSNVRSRSRKELSHRIHRLSFAPPPVLPQQASSPRPAIAAASAASRLILRAAAQFAGAAGKMLLAIASWIVAEILVGCAAYAMAMYGIPDAVDDDESGDAMASTPPEPARNSPRPALHIISVDRGWDIRATYIVSSADTAQPCAGTKSAARSEQTSGARSGWRTVIMARADLLLSKIREGSARRRAIAELQSLDDRILRDIGISRSDIGGARYGAQPE